MRRKYLQLAEFNKLRNMGNTTLAGRIFQYRWRKSLIQTNSHESFSKQCLNNLTDLKLRHTANLDTRIAQQEWKNTIKRALRNQAAQKDHKALNKNPNHRLLAKGTGNGDYTKFNILGKHNLWNIKNRSKIIKLVLGCLTPNNTDTCPHCNIMRTDLHTLLNCKATAGTILRKPETGSGPN